MVFFRKQDSLTNDLQKQFISRLGELSGRPTSSTLHTHPILNNTSEFGVKEDSEISTISSQYRAKHYLNNGNNSLRRNTRNTEASWHSDIQFEEVPADYTSLRIVQLPKNGGDILWASGLSSLPGFLMVLILMMWIGYEVYDRFSKPYQKLFDSLSVTYVGDGFLEAAESGRAALYEKPRGSPKNVGTNLSAVHPLVRTNPVTGYGSPFHSHIFTNSLVFRWKSVFGIGNFPKVINELDPEESAELLKKFYHVILDNHDIQVRFKWKNPNDIGECTFLCPKPALEWILTIGNSYLG